MSNRPISGKVPMTPIDLEAMQSTTELEETKQQGSPSETAAAGDTIGSTNGSRGMAKGRSHENALSGRIRQTQLINNVSSQEEAANLMNSAPHSAQAQQQAKPTEPRQEKLTNVKVAGHEPPSLPSTQEPKTAIERFTDDPSWEKHWLQIKNENLAGLRTWLENTDKASLNKAFERNVPIAYLTPMIMNSGKRSGLLQKLNDGHRAWVIEEFHKQNYNISRDQATDIAFAFKTMDGKIKNRLVDRLQSNFKITDFLASQAEHIDGEYLKGLDRNNVEFIRKTYEHLASAAEKKGQPDLTITYREKALNIDGWAQDHFGPKPDFSLSNEDLLKFVR